MKLKTTATVGLIIGLVSLFGIAQADTALSVSCSGTASASAITWTANTVGGVAPVALLWGSGATTSSQTVSEVPGSYTMTIQATDASSTVATSSCSATVAASNLPQIVSFIASPSNIAVGQSAVLAWTVNNASSTSLDNGIGAVSSTSVTVSPAVTTTYHLSATNPNGTTMSSVTVTVGTSTSSGGTLQDKVRALLQQIAALQVQLAQLIAAHFGGTVQNPGAIPPGQIGKEACISLSRDLSEGDQGDDVRSIQQMLASDPTLGFTVQPTGFFGKLTKRALKVFQEQNSITASSTGAVGPLTRGFFSRHCGKGLSDDHRVGTSTETENNSTTTPRAENGNENAHENSGHGNSGHGNDGNGY